MNHKKWKFSTCCLLVLLLGVGIFSSCRKKEEEPQEQPEEPGIEIQFPEEEENYPDETEDEPLPESQPVAGRSREDAAEMVQEILPAINQYYDDYSPSVVYVTKNGYLYDVPGKAYVVVEELVELSGLREDFEGESVLFFYLRPADLQGIDGFSASNAEELEIFPALEVEDGFMMASRNCEGGFIAKKDLHVILTDYSVQRGRIRRFAPDSDEFLNVLAQIQDENGNQDHYDVRYMAGNQKYAVAVVSHEDTPLIIEEYVLVRGGAGYVMDIPHFENMQRYRVEINALRPDLHMDLMPTYNMQNYIHRMQGNFDDLLPGMEAEGMISDSDGALAFVSGINDNVYMEFESGRKFVGSQDRSGEWTLYEIANTAEGEAVLSGIHNNPPLFILRQDDSVA